MSAEVYELKDGQAVPIAEMDLRDAKIAAQAALARAEKAEARCEALEAACRRQVENIERWLETKTPAGPEESKAIYEQLKAALRAVKG